MPKPPKSAGRPRRAYESFGNALRVIRTEAGVGLRSLARAIEVSSSYLSRVENGYDPPPTPERLRAMAVVLDIPEEALVALAGRTGAALAEYVAGVPAASALFLDIARRNLDADQIARVSTFIETELSEQPPPRPGRSLASLIPASRIELNVACESLADLIDTGATLCASEIAGTSASEIAARLHEREQECPTALGNGVAVPHARLDGAPTVAALVTPAHPLRADTPDGAPLCAVVVLVAGARDEHMQILALIARLASHDAAEKLWRARSPLRARAILGAYG